MASNNNNEIISKASPHTIKKFELIETYIKSWAQKLMLNNYCNRLVFIDCMCNSGVYYNDNKEEVLGTPIRVANILKDIAKQYPQKEVYIYFNDINKNKIDLLESRLPDKIKNFYISLTSKDGNFLLRELGAKLNNIDDLHYFLLYDPYDANIDWEALLPFFRNWGEVLINHMISDPIRAIRQVKSDDAKKKYMNTYLIDDVEKLLPFGSNKTAYEKRLEDIINIMKGSKNKKYYIAAFPFFNTRNSLVYDLVHCTSHEKGFKLFKSTAWKTFGDRSSLKNRHGEDNQLVFDFNTKGCSVKIEVDENCYNVNDIASYLQNIFRGKKDISFDDLWLILDKHPIFPSEGYKKQIKSILKEDYGALISKSKITFSDRR